MKKLISLILALAMVFSLAMPAMAAEVTGNKENPTSGDVTASYTPTPAEITGVSITVDGIEYTSGNVTIKPDSTVSITVTGTNLQNGTEDNRVSYASGIGAPLGQFTVSENGTTATHSTFADLFVNSSNFEIKYYNNYTDVDNRTAVPTGIIVTYDDGSSEPADVSVSMKLASKDANGVDTPAIFATISYTSLTTFSTTTMTIPTGEYTLTSWGNVPTGYKTPSDVVLNVTDEDGDGVGEVTTTSSHASVALVDGVYVITLTLEAEGTEPDTTPTITGVRLSGTGVTYDEATKTYTVAHDATDIVLTVSGTNFANLTSDYRIKFCPVTYMPLQDCVVDTTANTATESDVPISWLADCDQFEIKYSTDNGANYVGMGIYVTYDDGTTPTYQVIINPNSTNGTVTAKVNDTVVTEAAEGDTVTLTATPDERYALYSITVYDGDNNPVTVNSDNTFTMPDSNVSVYARFLKPGTDLTKLYFNNGGSSDWTNVKAYFYTSDYEALGYVDLSIEPGESNIYATTEIPEWAANVVFYNGEAFPPSVEIPMAAANTDQFNRADNTWSKFTATEQSTTSASISWGSMAFTYTDEAGAWANDGTEGAGTVTVTNTGDTTFTAQAAYTATTEEYGTFTAPST